MNLYPRHRVMTRHLPAAGWKVFLFHCLLLLVLLLSVQVGDAAADGLFDFQMKLAEKGNAEAQFKIGEMYESGRGVDRDMEQAKAWINKAAKQGHVTAGYKLLYWDLAVKRRSALNESRLEKLMKSAAAGEGQAQYYYGKMLANGVGVKKDSEQALDWLNKAALQGVLEAESEAAAIRDSAQRQQAERLAAEKKRKVDQQSKQAADKRKNDQAQAQAKARAEAQRKADKERAIAAQREADRKRSDTQKKRAAEEAAKAERLALEKQREARRAALLSKRKEQEAKRKAKFESDPCAGKSARFLSTCR